MPPASCNALHCPCLHVHNCSSHHCRVNLRHLVGNFAAKSTRSPGRKFLVPLLLWNSIARKDHWGWLNCGLGGIFVLESLSWAKEYNIELEKQQNNLGKIHHMCSHIYLLWEKGLVFYLYFQEFHMDFSLPTVIFAMAFLTKGSFFETPCSILFHFHENSPHQFYNIPKIITSSIIINFIKL